MIKITGDLFDTIRKLPSGQLIVLCSFGLSLVGGGYWFGLLISEYKVDKVEVEKAGLQGQLEQLVANNKSIPEPGFQKIEERVSVEVEANVSNIRVPIPDAFTSDDYVSHYVVNNGSGYMKVGNVFEVEDDELVFFVPAPPGAAGANVFNVLFAKRVPTKKD